MYEVQGENPPVDCWTAILKYRRFCALAEFVTLTVVIPRFGDYTQPISSLHTMAEQPVERQQPRDVKLPTFWPSRAAAWFQLAESRFRLKGIDDTQAKYDHLLSSLGDDVITDVLDVIERAGRDDDPYEFLKERLLETHSLSNFEKLDLLFKCEPLGSRKPSQLLASMLQFCPEGTEDGVYFHYLFLQRLPATLRAMLGDVEEGDPRALAARADRLLALNPAQNFAVASVAVPSAEDGDIVASVASNRGQQSRRRGGGNSARGNNRPAAPAGGGGGNKKVTPVNLAQQSSGLCYYHWTYGEKASSCKEPCSWQGN
jgi:hypothetical protein